MTLVEELERAAQAEERQVNRMSFHAELLRTAAAMITALKEETLSLLNKPELPLRVQDWEVRQYDWAVFGNARAWSNEPGSMWLVAVTPGGAVFAKRRAPARAELPTLTEEP